jgi:hypothetical protein
MGALLPQESGKSLATVKKRGKSICDFFHKED